MKTQEELNNLSKIILDASISVHRIMGPGLLESIYVECLVYELKNRGLIVDTEVTIPLIYKEKELSKRFRIDVLVENEIIIEVKAIEILLPVHEAQIISHLKLADKRLGFLINFNVPILIKGLKRFVNNF
ncbi:MAG: hypothetical protein KFKLKKLM_02172 [Flavobacteriales bacterium]|nr:MAG: GxxExxY protein [Flavobacteriales bacterium]MBV6485602.1 hypothetical protein [Flavobacteriales bacterium]